MKLVEVKRVNFFLVGMDKDAYDREVEKIVNAVRNGEKCVWNGKEGYFRHHHTASYCGYVSRKKECVVNNFNYNGRFGKGVTVLTPNFDSTQKCYIEYYIFEEA